MNKKVSWGDIPSLEGVAVDWEYKPQSYLDKRAFVRLDMDVMAQLLESREIAVKLATSKQTYDGRLVDISQGGLAMTLPTELEINLPVKVGLFLGATKVISRGLVMHLKKDGDRYLTGIRFVDLDPQAAEFIAGLYAAKILYRAT